VYVAKYWENLCLEEKDKSELEIAGFLRNIFKYSVYFIIRIGTELFITGLPDSIDDDK
jgi:hypothetical protein